MNKIPKATKILAAVAITLGIGAAGVGVIHAASTAAPANPFSQLVTAIAQKFNLNPTDVQNVVNQVRQQDLQQHQAQMQQNFAARLSQAVTAGKLTQAQADLITAKEREVQSFMATLPGQTEAQRQTAIQNEMASLRQWATANNIPTRLLPFLGGRGGHMARWGKHSMFAPAPNGSSTQQ